MAQHDYVIANQSGSAFRADLNNALSATVTGNSGSSAPSTTYAYMIWNDTTSNQRKIRNSANNAWIVLSTLSGGNVFDDDVTFNGASYNLVWDKSDNALEFADNAKCTFGDSDLSIYHDGSSSYIANTTGPLIITQHNNDIHLRPKTAEEGIIINNDGAVDLYYDNEKTFATTSDGAAVYNTNGYAKLLIQGNEGNGALLQLHADDGDDNADKVRLGVFPSNNFAIQNYIDGAWEDCIKSTAAKAVELYYDNVKTFETINEGAKVNPGSSSTTAKLYITGGEGGSAALHMTSDEGDDYGDYWLITAEQDTNYLTFTGRNTSGTWTSSLELRPAGHLVLKYDGSTKLYTNSDGIVIGGDVYPSTDNNSSYTCGRSDLRWHTVYAGTATINTSDRNEKNTILESDLGLDFVNKLKPVSYKWNQDDGKTHYGLIAQDIEETLSTEGKTDKDFAALDIPAKGPMGLNYSGLISPLIKAVQELTTKVETLETKVAVLEAK